MFIIEALPLGKGATHDPLSYFSSVPLARGSLIEVPVRKRLMPAIVLSATEAFSMKTALRAATFSLRKLPDQTPRGSISRELFETAEHTALYHATSVGAAMFSILPKEVREGAVPFALPEERTHIPAPNAKPCIFIAPEAERYREYKRMVRESFASHHSVLIVVPTIEQAHALHGALSSGIADYTLLLHGTRGIRALRSAYKKLQEDSHPFLIITTPHYACILRSDVGTIILEHARGGGYVGRVRPYLDYRFVLRTYAALLGKTIIIADTVIRTEEAHLLKTGAATTLGDLPKRLELPGALSIIAMKPDSNGSVPFSLFSKKLEKAIDTAVKDKKKVFLFGARRGLAPLVVCVDCGDILRDPNSGAPLSLSRTRKNGEEKRWFSSTVSGYRIPAYDVCRKCGSWRLKERGIGIQQIYDEVIKRYDTDLVTLFDRETASTHAKATALRDAFYARRGGILLGTALALPYLSEQVSVSAVVSMDSLRAIPSWRGEEESFTVLSLLREKTKETVFVQTRAEEDDELFSTARRGAIHEFYDRELTARKQFAYPPYMVFVHLTWRAETNGSDTLKKTIEQLFAPQGISLYSAPYGEQEGGINYALMRIPEESWPDRDIVSALRSLPPSVRIMINPDRII